MLKLLSEKSPPDAFAERIRARREGLGWSLAELAMRADLKSPSYVFHIEHGNRIPSEDVARRIARVLGEDADLFAAWARIRAGGTTLADREKDLQAIKPHLAPAAESAVRAIRRDTRHRVSYARSAAVVSTDPRGALVSPPIPVLKPGQDPGPAHARLKHTQHLALAVEGEEVVRRQLAELVAPFAYPLTPHSARRAPKLLPTGFFALVSRRVLPLASHEAYAVKVGNAVELGFVHWDGDRLLLLPHIEPEDLVVLRARSKSELLQHIVGRIAILLQPEIVIVES